MNVESRREELPLTNPDRPRLLSFTLDDWPVLGGPVSITLTDGVAVLVGRNGSGKSAILEGFTVISSIAILARNITEIDNDSIPKSLEIEILTPENRHLKYEYRLLPDLEEQSNSLAVPRTPRNKNEHKIFLWNERCQYVDGEQECLWETEACEVTLYHKGYKEEIGFIGPNNSLFTLIAFAERKSIQELGLPRNEISWIQKSLSSSFVLREHVTRTTPWRKPLVLKIENTLAPYSLIPGSLDEIALDIVRLEEKQELGEFEQVCRRIGLANDISIIKFVANSSRDSVNQGNDYVAEVLLDDVNMGLVSDGTIRVLAILLEVIHKITLGSLVILRLVRKLNSQKVKW